MKVPLCKALFARIVPITMNRTIILALLALVFAESIVAQPYVGGVYDFGQNRYGEHRGDLGPAAIAGITIGAVAVAAALLVTVYFCYYASHNSRSEYQQNHMYQKANGV